MGAQGLEYIEPEFGNFNEQKYSLTLKELDQIKWGGDKDWNHEEMPSEIKAGISEIFGGKDELVFIDLDLIDTAGEKKNPYIAIKNNSKLIIIEKESKKCMGLYNLTGTDNKANVFSPSGENVDDYSGLFHEPIKIVERDKNLEDDKYNPNLIILNSASITTPRKRVPDKNEFINYPLRIPYKLTAETTPNITSETGGLENLLTEYPVNILSKKNDLVANQIIAQVTESTDPLYRELGDLVHQIQASKNLLINGTNDKSLVLRDSAQTFEDGMQKLDLYASALRARRRLGQVLNYQQTLRRTSKLREQ